MLPAVPPTEVRVTALGNAGFALAFDTRKILLDPYIVELPDVPLSRPESLNPGDLVLVTHSHWDHLNAGALQVAARRGAQIVVPEPGARKLRGRVPDECLTVLEPPSPGDCQATTHGEIVVTAFRTRHGMGHNSYLVELPGFRLFNDGDNEHTDCLDAADLGDLDALFISTWQGARWVEFIEALQPACWILFHLSEDELGQAERGEYFVGLCDHVPLPDRLLAPWPGETISRPRRAP